jgi:hypothetical protein
VKNAIRDVRRDGVRDKVNELRARRDRREEKPETSWRARVLGARAAIGPRGSNARPGTARGQKTGVGAMFLESAKMFTASGNAFVTL